MPQVWWPRKIFPLCWANHLVLNKLGKSGSKVVATAWLYLSLCDKCIVWNYYWALRQKRKNTADCVVCSLHSTECMMWRLRACADAGADLIKGENSLKKVWISLCECMGKNLVVPGTWQSISFHHFWPGLLLFYFCWVMMPVPQFQWWFNFAKGAV